MELRLFHYIISLAKQQFRNVILQTGIMLILHFMIFKNLKLAMNKFILYTEFRFIYQ